MTLEHDLLQLARDAIRSLMNGRDFGTGQIGHYLNIISRIEAELARPQPEFDTPESHIVKWSIPVDPNNFGEPLAQSEQEPVAWAVLRPDGRVKLLSHQQGVEIDLKWTPLYTKEKE
jgi:hypothetical protein